MVKFWIMIVVICYFLLALAVIRVAPLVKDWLDRPTNEQIAAQYKRVGY